MTNPTNQTTANDQPDPLGAQIKPHITSPGALLSDSIKIYRVKFKQFMSFTGLTLLAYIPMGIIFGIFYTLDKKGDINLSISIILGVLAFLGMLFFLYLSVSAQIGNIFIASDEQKEKFKETFVRTVKFFWPFFIVRLLVAVLIILWSILFIIPGLIFAVYYSFTSYAVLFENARLIQAVKRSKHLVKGYWWAIVGRVLLISVIYYVVIMIISMPTLFFNDNLSLIKAWNIITNLIGVVIAPIYVIYNYKIFKDLQQIKGEGVKDL